MKDAKGHGSDARGGAAHQAYVGGLPTVAEQYAIEGHATPFGSSIVPYYGMVNLGKRGDLKFTGPFNDRTAARNAARAINPKAWAVSTGYGHGGPHYDVRIHHRHEQ